MYIVLSNMNSSYLRKVPEYEINLGKSIMSVNINGKVTKNQNNQLDSYMEVYESFIQQIGNIRTINIYVDSKLSKNTARIYTGKDYKDIDLTKYDNAENMLKTEISNILNVEPVKTVNNDDIEAKKKAWIERLQKENNN